MTAGIATTAEAAQPNMNKKQNQMILTAVSIVFLLLALIGMLWSFTSGLIGGGIDGILLLAVCGIVALAFAVQLLFLAADAGVIKLPSFAPAKPAAKAAAPAAAKPAAPAAPGAAAAKPAATAPVTTATPAPAAEPAGAPAVAPPAAVARPQQAPPTAPAAPIKPAPAVPAASAPASSGPAKTPSSESGSEH